MIDLPPKFDLWLPPKPAIIRRADRAIQKASFLPGMFPGGVAAAAAAPAAVSFTYNGQFGPNSATAQTTKTFASVSIGAATANRMVVIGFSYRVNATTNSVTVNGVGATRVTGSGIGFRRIEMWRAAVPTGISVTVTIVLSGTVGGLCAITSHSVYNLTSQTPTASITATNASATSINANINTVAPGIAIGVAMHDNVGSNSTWTNLTETSDQGVDDRYQMTTAALTPTITATPRNIVLAQAGTFNDMNMTIAHWN